MFNRPRCRDWTPLATQQLRLRNLIKVVGQNISCEQKCQLYFTLHSTTMSAPFFTSEKVEPHGGTSVNWAEINCQMISKSNSRYVWIRVWQHTFEDNDDHEDNRLRVRDEDPNLSERCDEERTQHLDKMLFIWGVYFSGLILITKKSEAKFQPNSLAFEMHGGFFASPETLSMETVREQFKMQCYSHDLFEVTANNDKNYKNSISTRKGNERAATESCDISNNLTSSDISSSTILVSKAPIAKDEFQINSPRTSRSCSPVNVDFVHIYRIKSPEDILTILKSRYIELRFLKSEVRPGYNLQKLLELQEKQRKFRYRSENANEVKEKICMRSAFCLNPELISNKSTISYRPRSNPSMGRTLNRLLFQENRPSPADILRAQELRRLIETARFRTRLLLQERDRTKVNLRHLETKLGQLHDNNIEQGSWLMSCYRFLKRERELLIKEKITVASQKEEFKDIRKSLKSRRNQLCSELKEVYPIEKNLNGHFAIHDVVLPNSENLPNGEKLLNLDHVWEPITPHSLSVALGYVGHVVQMCSLILDLPLRNPVIHEGSRSQIIDIVKDLPFSSREFPLYSRTNPPPKAVLYAVYLLNQNIAQLNFQAKGNKCDLRATLPNLLQLLHSAKSARDEIDGNHLGETSQIISACGSSVDLNVPLPPVMSKPVDVVDIKTNDQRISRSVGSYSDDQLSTNSKNFYSSEPILNIQKIHVTNFNENGDV